MANIFDEDRTEMFDLRILAIILGFNFKFLCPLPLSEFYPFGRNNGDRGIPREDDGNSGRVGLSTANFNFLGKRSDSLFVSISLI